MRHDSFVCEKFVDLARRRGAAIVTACDSDYPLIADATADFAYLRVMGAQDKAKLGYAPKALDLWASRTKALAGGEEVDGLATISPKGAPKEARDVFFYFISGFKERNPAAAAPDATSSAE